MLHFSALQIVLLVLVVLLLFGPKKLPELARGLGEGMKEFKQAVQEVSAPAEQPAAPAGAPRPTAAVSQSSEPVS